MTIAPPLEQRPLDVPPFERPGRPAPPVRAGAAWPCRSSCRGRPEDPAWVRPALLALLVVTAGLYLWDLGAQGWANAFYSAAVQAGHQELEGVLLRLVRLVQLHHRRQAPGLAVGHGALGPRLRPQLVEHPRARRPSRASPPSACSTRRCGAGSRPAAGLIAGAGRWRSPRSRRSCSATTTPTPCWCSCSSWPSTRPSGRSSRAGRCWLVLAGTAVGFGFITKMLQAFVVVPALALVYLLAGPPKLGRRHRPAAVGRRRAGRVGRVVGGRGAADPGRRPALHRRVPEQQPAQPHLRLQRLRPHHRQRDRQRRRGGGGGTLGVGADRVDPAVQRRRSAARSRGSSRPRWSSWPRSCG